MNNDEISHGEIVIVKRGGGGHDDGHHGGVWKIAFADFMTAMMAFFLVMWLINASNEKTKKAVASYFNPIKLMDTASSPKGIRNPEHGSSMEVANEESPGKQEGGSSAEPDQSKSVDKDSQQLVAEQALFIDPYAILSEIAGGITETESGEQRTSDVEESQLNRIGISGGKSFQDPFDPTSWSRQVGLPKDPLLATSPENRMGGDGETLNEIVNSRDAGMMRESVTEELAFKKEGEPEEKSSSERSESISDSPTALAEALAGELKAEVREAMDAQNLASVDLDVVPNGNGVAVILSDKGVNGMFNIGSARPTQELVKAMEKIGAVVAKHDHTIEISGHTDGRKFQSADYDNWRLSSARAQMAYYMLVRGGMNEAQVERIIGEAAVRLKVPEDPYAAANRRIEVFLRLPSS